MRVKTPPTKMGFREFLFGSPEKDKRPSKSRGKKKEEEEPVNELQALKDEVKRMKDAMREMVQEHDQLVSRIEELEKNQASTKAQIEIESKATKSNSTYLDKLKKGLTKPAGAVTVTEVTNLNDRRMNLVLKGIEEPEISDFEDRKEEERRRILDVIETVKIDKKEFEDSIKIFHRLGKREGKDGKMTKFRPILVKLNSTAIRERTLANAKLLRSFNEENSTRLRIDPDLSPAQTANLDNLWMQAREKSVQEAKNGKRYYVIGKEDPQLKYRLLSEDEKKTAKQDAKDALERAQLRKKKNQK